MVFVVSKNGKPLAPMCNARARILRKQNRVVVLRVNPFVIQLTYETASEETPEMTLGIDSGYLNIGFSIVSDKKEIISGEVKLRSDMSQKITDKKMYRVVRRGRLRYRKPRFNNRKVETGWIAPSIQHKLDSHIRLISKLKSFLPITNIVIEVANFDIQRMKNQEIKGKEYQEGDQFGFENTKSYILHRDGYKCQNPNCVNKPKDQKLQVHHITFRSKGGTNKPSNLITLCDKCHKPENHLEGGFLYDWYLKGKNVKGFKDATFMTIIRTKLIKNLEQLFGDIYYTFGFITKMLRQEMNIEKAHVNDAFVIAGGFDQSRSHQYNIKQVRRNNRSLELFYDAKYIDSRTGEIARGKELNSGRITRNKSIHTENLRVFRKQRVGSGRRSIRRKRYFYQPGDLVKYNGKIDITVGTLGLGKYVKLKVLAKSVNPSLLQPYKFSKGLIWQIS